MFLPRNIRLVPAPLAAWTDYTPTGPWADGTVVVRNSDGVGFTYSASLNALTINPNISYIVKNANNFEIINLPTPTNTGDAANKAYVDAHSGGGGLADAPSDGNHYARFNATWANIDEVYMRWVPYTGTSQPFLKQDLTRDGDWTMVANKDTTTRPAPQPSGSEEDLLPIWTPTTPSAVGTYTVYNEWTINTAGWIDQYGVDIHNRNTGQQHVITLQVNGVVKDTFTTTPNAAMLYWHDITPILVLSGAVIRVTLQITSGGNNFWYQQTGLFATAPTYCSLAVGSKDGAAAGTTAYGCHLLFTPGAASPDWDVVAYGGAAAGGGGGLTDAPADGTTYGRLNNAWASVPVPATTTPGMDGTGAAGVAVTYSRGDHVHPTDTTRAPLASPAFTGTPTSPTPASADSSTNISTTAFVKAQGYLIANQSITLSGNVTGSGTTAITTTIAASAVTNAMHANVAAYTLNGNATGASAAPTNFTIGGLTAKTTPVATDQLLLQDNAASGALKSVPWSSLPSGGGGIIDIKSQIFTATGTYTPSAGMVFVVVEAVGGGGGGGGMAGSGANTAQSAGGGGAGAYSRSLFSAATIGSSQAVTIGAAGLGGAAGNNTGGSGGTTSLGSLLTAPGGSGGGGGPIGNCGVGGVAGTGNVVNAPGAPGGGGIYAMVAGMIVPSGVGGSGQFGSGGVSSYGNGSTVAGSAGLGYGAGGSGASTQGVAAATTAAGGAGTAGKLIITEYCTV